MAMTLRSIAQILTTLGVKFCEVDPLDRLACVFPTRCYRDCDGDPCLIVSLYLDENGEYLILFAENLYQCPEDHPHRAAVREVLGALSACFQLVRFFGDEKDGEIYAHIELPLDDNTLTERQMARVINLLPQFVDKVDPLMRRALETGDTTIPDGFGQREEPDLPPVLAPVPDVCSSGLGEDEEVTPAPQEPTTRGQRRVRKPRRLPGSRSRRETHFRGPGQELV